MIHPYFDIAGDEARGLLYGLLEVNKYQLARDPSMPSMRQLIREGKVKYRQEDPTEHWQTYREIVGQVKQNGVAYADCEDLAPAVGAEDQVRYGVASLPFAYRPRVGLYHVVTAVPEGPLTQRYGGAPFPIAEMSPVVAGYRLEDPSAAAGMTTFGSLPPNFAETGRASYGALHSGDATNQAKKKILGSRKDEESRMPPVRRVARQPVDSKTAIYHGIQEGVQAFLRGAMGGEASSLADAARLGGSIVGQRLGIAKGSPRLAGELLKQHREGVVEDYVNDDDLGEDFLDTEFGGTNLGPPLDYSTGILLEELREPVQWLGMPMTDEEEAGAAASIEDDLDLDLLTDWDASFRDMQVADDLVTSGMKSPPRRGSSPTRHTTVLPHKTKDVVFGGSPVSTISGPRACYGALGAPSEIEEDASDDLDDDMLAIIASVEEEGSSFEDPSQEGLIEFIEDQL